MNNNTKEILNKTAYLKESNPNDWFLMKEEVKG